jgi:diaminopimelate decarboxylase
LNELPRAERPPGFIFQDVRHSSASHNSCPVLCCEQIPLSQLAQQFGTPLYVYSATALLQRSAAFQQAFRKVPHTVCYSVKANSNLSILRLLARQGCGFDVVSGGELERVLAVDRRAARRVVFSGVGKSREEMLAALKAGILLFNVESDSELWTLEECARRLRKIAPLALRVNPDVAAETHPYISTGLRQHKFGVPIHAARTLYEKAGRSPHLRVAGVSVHIGSQITDVSPFAQAMQRVVNLVRGLRRDGHKIELVDIGGGLGIDYTEPANHFARTNSAKTTFAKTVAAYAKAVTSPLRGLRLHLLLEPGRSIVGPAGVLLTSVVYRKENEGKKFVVVDAGMNDLIRPSLYGAHHTIVSVSPRATNEKELVDVVGPVCESGDFFARDRELSRLEEGDLLAILDAGAYGMSLASNYNTRPRPAEVLVRGNKAALIRRRETVADLYAPEL